MNKILLTLTGNIHNLETDIAIWWEKIQRNSYSIQKALMSRN